MQLGDMFRDSHSKQRVGVPTEETLKLITLDEVGMSNGGVFVVSRHVACCFEDEGQRTSAFDL